MSAVYNYESSARDDPLANLVINAMNIGVAMMTPERAMILQMFPFRECSTSLMRKFMYPTHLSSTEVAGLVPWILDQT
jgi:hypothetical protein